MTAQRHHSCSSSADFCSKTKPDDHGHSCASSSSSDFCGKAKPHHEDSCASSSDTDSAHPDFGDLEGRDVPFHPDNMRCNAPCPPGAGCNTAACSQTTEYYVQKWTCLWKQTALDCRDQAKPERGYTKAWRCRFQRIPRCDVLRAFAGRPQPRCPRKDGDDDCFVPEDAYFARVWEIEYAPCQDDPQDDQDDGCCGVRQVLNWRFVKINSRADVPPQRPLEPSKPWAAQHRADHDDRDDGRRAPRSLRCAGALCKVGPAKSPDYWLAPVFPYA
jgi:hypothetical protein